VTPSPGLMGDIAVFTPGPGAYLTGTVAQPPKASKAQPPKASKWSERGRPCVNLKAR
jgi:hypothetical protein